MTLAEMLLLLLVGWTVLGVVGVTVSAIRRERGRVRRGLGWMAGVWVVYLLVVVVVSRVEKQRVVAVGQEQCFDEMCFRVVGADEVPGFLIRDGRRLIRVRVEVENRGHKAESEKLIRAYLVDAEGRDWEPLQGIAGVPLTERVGPGERIVSEPVFKVAADATGLALVFTHGRWQPGRLVIGDSDSLFHRPTVVPLGR
jgi:hypothetical protein